MELREVTELETTIELLRDIKESADKGVLWRDPSNYSEEYRRRYGWAVSALMDKAIAHLKRLENIDKESERYTVFGIEENAEVCAHCEHFMAYYNVHGGMTAYGSCFYPRGKQRCVTDSCKHFKKRTSPLVTRLNIRK